MTENEPLPTEQFYDLIDSTPITDQAIDEVMKKAIQAVPAPSSSPVGKMTEEEVWNGIRSLVQNGNDTAKTKALQMAVDILGMAKVKTEEGSGQHIGIKVLIGVDPKDI